LNVRIKYSFQNETGADQEAALPWEKQKDIECNIPGDQQLANETDDVSENWSEFITPVAVSPALASPIPVTSFSTTASELLPGPGSESTLTFTALGQDQPGVSMGTDGICMTTGTVTSPSATATTTTIPVVEQTDEVHPILDPTECLRAAAKGSESGFTSQGVTTAFLRPTVSSQSPVQITTYFLLLLRMTSIENVGYTYL
jgi:hypothetical protein